ncbi:methenyltetrahydromethanopterin cyclohydrolase [Halorussus gelatinilyticus]|uniref:Methenyltetrahydromethanopterin cyclohydrolase n=1 Tax=Halorussus gelatinilyticus TaxID=2937524 RepID=A0A8U0IL17_9EURY|nr:methenyltetrahydromethanopterin cyclohydrolase [Halorussus gelatinilyticus]UPW01022.1 methenyltetrahydromethanopterin cyclohydrolase [Halorussus gelatinilyticus]
MDSLNRNALELADEALDFAEELDIGARELDNGATVLDFGHEFDGGVEAGLLLAEMQTAGLATVQTRMDEVAGAPFQHVELTSDHPALALLCSQKAGWEVATDDFEGLGSGPARALVAEEDEFARVGYEDVSDFAVLAVESDDYPTEAAAEQVADLTGVETSSVFLAAVPTACLAGSVSIASRAAEMTVFRLSELGYDPLNVVSITGSAPVAPVAGDEETAIARTNDALAYGGEVHVTVREEFDRFDEIVSTANDEYGTHFADIFESVDWDFYEVEEGVFAPARATVDVIGGDTYVVGERDEELLAESFGI